MKPIPNRTPNQFVSATAVRSHFTAAEQDSFAARRRSDITIQGVGTATANVACRPAEVDPVLAHGCVDWYLYRDSNREC